jgi:hypothetical protein
MFAIEEEESMNSLRLGMLNSIALGACAIALLTTESSAATADLVKTAWFEMTPEVALTLDIDSTTLAPYTGVLQDLADLKFKTAGLIVKKDDFVAAMKADAQSSELISNIVDTDTLIHVLDASKAIELGLIAKDDVSADSIVVLAIGAQAGLVSEIFKDNDAELPNADVAAYFGKIIDAETDEIIASRMNPAVAAKQNGVDHSIAT